MIIINKIFLSIELHYLFFFYKKHRITLSLLRCHLKRMCGSKLNQQMWELGSWNRAKRVWITNQSYQCIEAILQWKSRRGLFWSHSPCHIWHFILLIINKNTFHSVMSLSVMPWVGDHIHLFFSCYLIRMNCFSIQIYIQDPIALALTS